MILKPTTIFICYSEKIIQQKNLIFGMEKILYHDVHLLPRKKWTFLGKSIIVNLIKLIHLPHWSYANSESNKNESLDLYC